MNSFREVIDALAEPSIEALAGEIGEKGGTVRQWRRRDSIPFRYWPRIAEIAEARSVPGINVKTLMHIAQLKTTEAA